MRAFSVGLSALILSLASACAVPPQRTASATPASPPPKTAALNPDQVICRSYESTGTRLRQQKICKTRADWDADARDAQDSMGAVERQGAGQSGGESLPLPGH